MFSYFLEDYSWLMAVFCFISIFLLWLRRAPMPRENARPAADWERSIIMPKVSDAMLGDSGRLSRDASGSSQHSARLAVMPLKRTSNSPAGYKDDDLFDFEPSTIGAGIVVEQTSTLQQAQFSIWGCRCAAEDR
ncbi:hypothetical protein EJG51_017775 [Undibacterium piscinae]|uniref:Uncharacterized protein n=1 Tax=Undibacterium piscinae TaxID=2495591 RepID=A0A6M4A844_9BURK|nr:hypothetical protein EJG51_017775 [Undibacterium piscinae]